MKNLSLFLLLVLVLASCRKDMDIIDPPVGPEPQIVVNATVNGQVLDSNGQALEDAVVIFKNENVTTDQNGVFSFSDTDLYQDGTFITVYKDGFFTGSRMFYPTLNETSNVVIQLIEKTVVGTVSSTTGGKVVFNDASINLPALGIVNQDGSDYTGSVDVVAKWLNPEAEETFYEMPGDLVGISTDDDQMALATYGMLAVELEDESGNLLQIKEGFTADIEVPVPPSLLANAPNEIPLWHFDMDTGYWTEEGSATLVNGKYEGKVSHFSFWNCDAPFPLIQLSGFIQINGNGLENIKIRITDNSTGFSACGFTSGRGYFIGKVPKDQNMTLEVLDECGNVIYTDSNVGPYSDDTTLPTIDISVANNNPVTVTGSVGNCTGQAIENSYILIQFDNNTSKTFSVEDDGSFEFTIINCNSEAATVYGVDVTNDLISDGFIIDFSSDVEIGLLEACEDFINYKLIVTYPGSTWNSASVQDTVASTYEVTVFPNAKNYKITAIDWISSEVMEIEFTLEDGAVMADWSGTFASDGFTCNGTDASSGIVVNDLGVSFITLSGTTTDITVTDSNLFDPDIVEVTVEINIPL